MKKLLVIAVLLCNHNAQAIIDNSSALLYDYQGNGITSNANTSGSINRNPLDVELPGFSVSGSLTGLGSIVVLPIFGTCSVNMDVTGTFVGNIYLSESNASAGRVLGLAQNNSSALTTTISAPGNYRVFGVPAGSSAWAVQAQFQSYTSGTANIVLSGSTACHYTNPMNFNASNLLMTSYLNDGSGNSISSTNGSLNVNGIVTDTLGTGSITVQDTASTSGTNYNNQTIYTGTPTTGSVVTLTTMGIETGMISVTGTWTGTLQTEISADGGTTWIPHSLHQIGSPDFIVTFTSNFVGSLNLAAKNYIRVRAISAMTGTANIRITQSLNPSSVYIANAIKLLDGSSTTSTTTLNIVPASTAASSTNTAMVVGLSPNSSLPSGTNSIGKLNPNVNGTLSATQFVTTTESYLAAPSNAVAVIFESDSTNSGNIRWGFSNSTTNILSSTLGLLMEPGRNSGQLSFGVGIYVHFISLSGTNSINVQWVQTQ